MLTKWKQLEFVDFAQAEKIKLCAAGYEENDEQGRGPTVHPFHKFLGEITDIAEYGAQHHAGQERGEVNLHAYVKMQLGKRNGQEHKCNGHGKSF